MLTVYSLLIKSEIGIRRIFLKILGSRDSVNVFTITFQWALCKSKAQTASQVINSHCMKCFREMYCNIQWLNITASDHSSLEIIIDRFAHPFYNFRFSLNYIIYVQESYITFFTFALSATLSWIGVVGVNNIVSDSGTLSEKVIKHKLYSSLAILRDT